jgi:glucosamine-phosphate N-acetyltransferase
MIRRLRKSDYKQYTELLSQLTEVGDISQIEFEERFDELGQSVRIYIIEDVATKMALAAGTLCIEPKFIHRCSKLGHIEDIVVHRDYRNKKLGTRMIDFLVNLARESKCYKVRLVCDQKNVNFYKKCSFTENGVEMNIRF